MIKGTRKKKQGTKSEEKEKRIQGPGSRIRGKNLIGRQKPDMFDLRKMSNVFRVKRQVIGDADGGDKNILSADPVASGF